MIFGGVQQIAAASNAAEKPGDEHPILLVVSFDGFRPDYLQRNITPTLNEIRKQSARTEYMRNVFPTKTFVNHFTMATGLYPATHGVMANQLYDNKLRRNIHYSYELFHFNDDVVPIWVNKYSKIN